VFRKPIRDYLARFNFKSELLIAMYATTDGFSGYRSFSLSFSLFMCNLCRLSQGYDQPGTGMNFLIHNMCRLKGSNGVWYSLRFCACDRRDSKWNRTEALQSRSTIVSSSDSASSSAI
jgi:hypothetical protein